ncbi:DNA-binding protein [Enterovirga rhinocerotis]|uniref:Uncharacterized protein n=1 Tax=Enterovirga rhinocerotis TaxID=1339210 RepID=A0A4R7BWR1_9HYPH|nr:DNA-binding protein [Enterovirga rhinocerotis]TDR89125.1 hypothetical protein EV668_3613 [Enterovirga rhinocerotis]
MQANANAPLADDLMRGADAIRRFMFGEAKDEQQAASDRRTVYHLLTKGELGLFKIGGVVCGRKSTMLAKIAEAEGRAA